MSRNTDMAKYHANEARIEALVARTGKTHLAVWSHPQLPGLASEWLYWGASHNQYAEIDRWCNRMDRITHLGGHP